MYKCEDPVEKVVIVAVVVVGAAFTAYDVYQAYQEDGIGGSTRTLAEEAALSLVGEATVKIASMLYRYARAARQSDQVAEVVSRKIDCLFSNYSLVITDSGDRKSWSLKQVILSCHRDEVADTTSWKLVLGVSHNDYDYTTYLTIKDDQPGSLQTITSNKIHTYFAVITNTVFVKATYRGSEGFSYGGEIENGQWIDKADLIAGDRLFNHDGRWSVDS